MTSEIKQCQNCKNQFTIESEDFDFYEKIKVPPPTFCPLCRFQRRLHFRNERTYYRRKCDLCKKDIIAVYPSEVSFPVYCVKCWWSDKWDPTEYGRDYDPSRPFLEQFRELFYAVPMLAMENDDGIGSVNCQYTYDFAFGKNCYLVVCDWETEDSMYSYHVCQSKDMVDSYNSNHCNFSYELVNCRDCYGSRHCTLCISCQDCILGFDLRGCSDCIMCVGLRNKKYCIRNQQYSKEEYEQRRKDFRLENRGELEKFKKEFEEFELRFPRRYAYVFKSPYSTGDILFNCKAARDCFYFQELEDCRYMVQGDGGKNSYDCNNTGRPNLCYESVTPDNSYRNLATIYCWKCTQAEYSNNCHSCSYVLGCSGLRHTEYAILNKKYSKEEYLSLREKIVQEMKAAKSWGEFFPVSMSPHAYNESPAQDWIPLTKNEAIQKGFRWNDPRKRDYSITIQAADIPQSIGEVSDAILNETLGCRHNGVCEEKCTVAFKIVPQELQFYRKMNIALPEYCHNCRYYQRLERRNRTNLYHRRCTCAGPKSESGIYANTISHFHGVGHCPNEFETSYAPERPEIVYCEQCYNSEVA